MARKNLQQGNKLIRNLEQALSQPPTHPLENYFGLA